MDARHFADWLMGQLEQRGWTQSELARRAGRPRQTISGYINARVDSPDPDVLNDMARALDLPASDLLQAAGILQTNNTAPPNFDEWKHIFLEADEEERERLLDYARYIRRSRR